MNVELQIQVEKIDPNDDGITAKVKANIFIPEINGNGEVVFSVKNSLSVANPNWTLPDGTIIEVGKFMRFESIQVPTE